MNPEEPTIGNGPGVGDRELARTTAPAHRAGGPIPDDPRPQLREALRWVATVEHVKDVLELLAPEIRVWLGAGDDALDLVYLELSVSHH